MKKIFSKFILILFLFVEICGSVWGQTIQRDSIHFTGAVYDAVSLTAISEVHITGKEIKTTSALDGGFSIWVRTGDTLIFSHISYKKANWIISDTIDNPDMLVGIFLVQDTVNVAEVVVYPRLMSLESLMAQPLPQDKDIRNAKNNLNILGYQARNTREATWDAEMNQRYALQKAQMGTEYKGLLPPDAMVPITAIIPLALALIRQKYQNDNKEKLKVSPQEEDLMKSLFIRKKMEEGQD
ncbi:MAG: hypothetical protein K9H64_14745 [Bacteroidales bacterium]|nr:hypothetical protein [Bacteroidales bacterium]MCF8457224.1 hypothetical protein [Bacteroidales bacterium]